MAYSLPSSFRRCAGDGGGTPGAGVGSGTMFSGIAADIGSEVAGTGSVFDVSSGIDERRNAGELDVLAAAHGGARQMSGAGIASVDVNDTVLKLSMEAGEAMANSTASLWRTAASSATGEMPDLKTALTGATGAAATRAAAAGARSSEAAMRAAGTGVRSGRASIFAATIFAGLIVESRGMATTTD